MNNSAEIFVDSMSEHTATAAAKEIIEFEDAFALHHRVVFRAACSVLRDSALAEDITQETFIRLHKHNQMLAEPDLLRPWLIRVAINLAKNNIRGNIRANTREDNYVKDIERKEVISVETEYEELSGISDIYRALDKVREPLRSCLVLKQQGLSYREIAESLSIKESSIGTYVARARQEFAKYYRKA